MNVSGLIAGTDQASGSILLLDPAASDWNAEDAVRWSWSPSAGNGFGGLSASWGYPTDAKVRSCRAWEGRWVVVVDSNGLAGIVRFPEGDIRWGVHVGGNPHSAELLPNGNLAVAASRGGWVRVYTSSQGPSSDVYSEYKLPGAHGVYWDAREELLWAVGDDALVALRVEGTDAQPVIRERGSAALPTRHGHDLEPVHGDPDRLWVSTVTGVYQYVKSLGVFDDRYPGWDRISRRDVKSVGNIASGTVVSTVPRAGSLHEWTTDMVYFHQPDSTWVCVRTGAAFYKARIWMDED